MIGFRVFGVTLIAGIVLLIAQEDKNSQQKKTAHRTKTPAKNRCDGNCSRCPAHYGYRYGRWYYGHGHQYGCERGGNGGSSGRRNREP